MPKTAALYFRTSAEVRLDLEQYAGEAGLTLSTAIGKLVERGLEAVSDQASVRTP